MSDVWGRGGGTLQHNLSNAIFTNNRLYHWNKVESKQCEYCNNEIQTTAHLLYKCTTAQRIWQEFAIYAENEIDVDKNTIQINLANILLNEVHPKAGHLVNFAVLVIKQTIFAQKCLGERINFDIMLDKIEEYYRIEKYNAIVNRGLKKHNEKWIPLKGELDVEILQSRVEKPTISGRFC